MRFLEDTDLLKIEDILPFFPDFVVIDDFKEEIAHALEGYSAHIDDLKKEMDDATRTAESIKQDIVELKSRFVTIDAGERCSVCAQHLLTRQSYIFPCQHTFHADCLIGLVSSYIPVEITSFDLCSQAKEYLPSHALRRIIALQTELVKDVQKTSLADYPITMSASEVRQPTRQRTLLSANFASPLQNGTKTLGSLGRNVRSAGDRLRDLIVPDALASVVSAPGWIPGIGTGGGQKGPNKDAEQQAEKLRMELDDVLASSCPLCESVIAGLDKPFVNDGEVDLTWAL